VYYTYNYTSSVDIVKRESCKATALGFNSFNKYLANSMSTKKIAIIGAGPAGLTAAYLLGKGRQDVVVFEADPKYVGGISRTETYKGFHFDIGGHRFFSKSQEIEDFWSEILGDDMLERPRSSSIYYNEQFFSYPLVASEALKKLGFLQSALCVMSYMRSRIFPNRNPGNFEEWVSNEFGKRLYRIFFKTYTEKVWGVSCTEISADWAAQRIKGLSLSSAIWNAVLPKKNDKNGLIKTLIDSFRYPKYGPGMMWEVCAAKSIKLGVEIKMDSRVSDLKYEDGEWTITLANGEQHGGFDDVISSAPIRDILTRLTPALPAEALNAAKKLSYRDFLTVVLILKDRKHFTENWIYIHDPSVKVGRIQNFKSWSPYMVPDADMACFGLEYFCFEGDGLWNLTDDALIELGKSEIEKIGIADAADVLDGYVVRQPKAYPVYDNNYTGKIAAIRRALSNYPGLHLVGRNGMHKYNNQDHSMMTAMLAAKNIISGEALYNLWNVNQDAEYHENGERAHQGGRQVPMPVS
jgi:protoporphyrinogen oxidase